MAIQEIKVDKSIYKFEGITEDEAEKLRVEVLCDPVVQTSEVNPEMTGEKEIAYKKGVTDPLESSLIKASNLLGISPEAVSTSEISDRDPSQIEVVLDTKPETLVYQAEPAKTAIVDIRDLSDSELEELSINRSLFLNLEEMKVLREYYKQFGREPTDLEIEVFAQTWSEHCYHKTFKARLLDGEGNEYEPLIERIRRTSEKYFEKQEVVSAFSDNAGGMRFYDGYAIIAKGETHNSPVAIDPFGGAATKLGGLERDIVGFGKGGRNLIGNVINNFAYPHVNKSEVPEGVLQPKNLLLENSRGEREYGNPMGIPTHGVNVHFHPDFAPKPTSLGIAIGITEEVYSLKETPREDDFIVTMGGRTGRDGIHGATFSSGEMTVDTQNLHSAAVQLGDPIVEKAMFDAIEEIKQQGLIRSITDCGAGGYSSAIGEMAQGVGAEVNLEGVPMKYEGLSPWEIFLSESQERMVLAVSPENIDELKNISRKFDTEATVIGRFSGDNHLVVKYEDEVCGDIDLEFLHDGLPQRVMKMNRREASYEKEPEIDDCSAYLKSKLSDMNIASKEEMHRMYDQTVQARTVMAPWVGVNQDIPSEASVLAPLPDKSYGVVTASACNPHRMLENPYEGAKWAFSYAAARFAAAGGDIDHACGVDNYIWPSPDEESLYGLHEATNGLVEMINNFEVPMVSGKDSLSSTFRGKDGSVIKAPPTLNITIFGKIPDFRQTVTPDIKSTESIICIVGGVGGNYENLPDNLRQIRESVVKSRILSAKAVGEGGLAIAITQMCIGGDCGAEIEYPENKLFSEAAGLILVEVESTNDLEGIIENFQVLGKTSVEKRLRVNDVLEESVEELREIWQAPMKEVVNG